MRSLSPSRRAAARMRGSCSMMPSTPRYPAHVASRGRRASISLAAPGTAVRRAAGAPPISFNRSAVVPFQVETIRHLSSRLRIDTELADERLACAARILSGRCSETVLRNHDYPGPRGSPAGMRREGPQPYDVVQVTVEEACFWSSRSCTCAQASCPLAA